MKVAVTAMEPWLDAEIDPRFGRCSYFVIVETEDEAEHMTFEAVKNPNLSRGHGAGIQSAELLARRGVECVLTGRCGPNAQQALTRAGVRVVTGCEGSVRGAVVQLTVGQVK